MLIAGRPVGAALPLLGRGLGTAHRAPPVVRVDPVDAQGNLLALPVYTPSKGPVEGVPWEDDDGTVYRVVRRLDPAEGWVAASTVMRWYGVRYETVARWVQTGLLDGARTQGSPSKFYRVLDPAKVQAAAKALNAKPGAIGRRRK